MFDFSNDRTEIDSQAVTQRTIKKSKFNLRIEKMFFSMRIQRREYLKASLHVEARLMISVSSRKMKTRQRGLKEWLMKASKKLCIF
jgi:hypothetical protein